MPWSRTRAYPHAFAVPEIKMGGGYNYMVSSRLISIIWSKSLTDHVADLPDLHHVRSSLLASNFGSSQSMEEGHFESSTYQSRCDATTQDSLLVQLLVSSPSLLSQSIELYSPYILRTVPLLFLLLSIGERTFTSQDIGFSRTLTIQSLATSGSLRRISSNGWTKRKRSRRRSSLSDSVQSLFPILSK